MRQAQSHSSQIMLPPRCLSLFCAGGLDVRFALQGYRVQVPGNIANVSQWLIFELQSLLFFFCKSDTELDTHLSSSVEMMTSP